MPSGLENTFLIAVAGEFIIGMLGNGFIVLVNCTDWMKNQMLSAADGILTSLAVSRIILLWITLFNSSVMVFWPHLYHIDKLANALSILWTLTNHLSTWFATCLSVFYFFKIANFSHRCFSWLRWRISRVLLVLTLGSLFLLFFNFKLLDGFTDLWVIFYQNYERNSTWPLDVSNTLCLNSLIMLSFIYLTPFLLSLTSLLLLFLSLMRHTRSLHLNSSSGDFRTEAHKKAMKMVMSFLILSTVHFFSMQLTVWTFVSLQKHHASLAVTLISALFPSGHSFVLILGNRKLRQAAVGLLRHLSCHLKMAEP
ncbi:taste receptor type 2 member 42-like [Suricata suricatta]|uniref:taste receptor type 2 member 42-like n=1 Tax=Suricata suricatta TaxID=37032 RepID=UPI001155FAE6|nr:taste receptor type 2 member 42-like [Suricata suricatta]